MRVVRSLILVAIPLTLLLTGCSGQYDADIQKCENMAKASLYTPSVAKFGDITVTVIDSHTFTIQGGVDSQNKFGAMLHGSFSCTKQDGEMTFNGLQGPVD